MRFKTTVALLLSFFVPSWSWAALLPALKILTFNVFGLPNPLFLHLSPLRPERLPLICEVLKSSYSDPNGWDLIFLQEAWLKKDLKRLKKCGYPYFVDANRKSLDTGLLILSRYPMDEIHVVHYRHNGSWRYPLDGERIVHKGVVIAKLHAPGVPPIWISNTHLVSQYPSHGYAQQRSGQLTELALALATIVGNDPLIIAGDFNLSPFGAGYSKEWDQWLAEIPDFIEIPNPQQICTSCADNTLTKERVLGQIDHIFVSKDMHVMGGGVTLKDPEMIDGEPSNLSDHYGWETTIQFPTAASLTSF